MKVQMIIIVIITITLTFFLSGCSEKAKVTTLEELCNGKLSKVDKIVVKNGNTGEFKSLTDKDKIHEIVTVLEKSRVLLHPNELSPLGWDRGYSFYYGNQHILDITRRDYNKFEMFDHDSFDKKEFGNYEEILE